MTLRGTVLAAAPLLQLTAAATSAWAIALQVGGHDDPFFAPITVVVALSSPLGERGSNAVRLLLGVMIGISVGELTTLALGGGPGRLALATFVAMAVVRLLGRPRLVMVQAASGAILTVAAADGEAGLNRLVDGAIGASVALVFSQIFFSPEPVALVRRAAAQALAGMGEALTLTAQALERTDRDLADEAMELLRPVRDNLAELARVRKVSGRVARRSVIWRSRVEPVVRENENAGHLDLLGASCLLLARAVAEADPGAGADRDLRTNLAASVQRLADALHAMAADPGDRATRQAAADGALVVAGTLPEAATNTIATVVVAARMVTLDVMVVAGVDADEAALAVQQGTDALRVPTPPRTPRLPSWIARWRAARRGRRALRLGVSAAAAVKDWLQRRRSR